MRHEFLTPEHVLYAITEQLPFFYSLSEINVQIQDMQNYLQKTLEQMERVPDGAHYSIEGSEQFTQMMSLAMKQAQNAEVDTIDIPHLVAAMLMLDDSSAAYILHNMIGSSQAQFFEAMLCYYDNNESTDEPIDETEKLDFNNAPWRQLVTCLNDTYTQHNPLIGRNDELERTIQVLCRKDKNNPLHVGEA